MSFVRLAEVQSILTYGCWRKCVVRIMLWVLYAWDNSPRLNGSVSPESGWLWWQRQNLCPIWELTSIPAHSAVTTMTACLRSYFLTHKSKVHLTTSKFCISGLHVKCCNIQRFTGRRYRTNRHKKDLCTSQVLNSALVHTTHTNVHMFTHIWNKNTHTALRQQLLRFKVLLLLRRE